MLKKTLKSIYQLIPFKKNLYEGIKVFGAPSSSFYPYLTFDAVFTVPVQENQAFKIRSHALYIETEIFWKGIFNSWEGQSLALWAKLCEDAEVVVDIGANTGVYSLLTQTLQQSCKVYAFEPIPRVFDKLKKNVTINNYPIHCIKKALSNRTGQQQIFEEAINHSYSATLDSTSSKQLQLVRSTEIETIRLDDFVEQTQLSKIDLLKIDAEGHEVEVLLGYGKYLEEHQPTIFIEIMTEAIAERLTPLFERCNYLYFNINERKKTVTPSKRLTKSEQVNFLLCSKTTAKKLKLV
ncbi:MAG: FkbM family methyltransferase [Saprospiraceae bacterium]|nr:FkbM family methyltransferase [Saprospiraceae bacterium]